MRTLLLASASVLLAGGTALAQNAASPMSGSASNVSAGTTHSAMAPRLPVSASDTSADQYLTHAQAALQRGHTGEAQEALERAETRLLSRSTLASEAGTPASDPKLQAVEAARQSLGKRDRHGAMQAIQTALSTPAVSDTAAGTSSSAAMPAAASTPTLMTPPAGPAPVSSVPPNSLGGISSSVGGDNGTGVGTNPRPQASFSGPTSSSNVLPSPTGAPGGASTSTTGSGAATPTP